MREARNPTLQDRQDRQQWQREALAARQGRARSPESSAERQNRGMQNVEGVDSAEIRQRWCGDSVGRDLVEIL